MRAAQPRAAALGAGYTWHVVATTVSPEAVCGALIPFDAPREPARRVDVDLRCGRPACRTRWPALLHLVG